MKKILISLTILFAVLEATLIPVDCVLIFAIFWAIFINEYQGLLAAFVGGILIDIFSFSVLGLHSIALVLGVAIVLILLRSLTWSYKIVLLIGYFVVAFAVYNGVLLILTTRGLSLTLPIAKLILDSVIAGTILLFAKDAIKPATVSDIRLKG